MLTPSLHVDQFTRTNLPSPEHWPQLDFSLPALNYDETLNCAEVLLERARSQASAAQPAIISDEGVWTYADLEAATNRFAHVLSGELGLRPGGRVLLRGENSAVLFACWLAVIKAGGVAVTTLPMLRSGELEKILEKAEVELALCQHDLTEALLTCRLRTPLRRIVGFGHDGAELETLARTQPAEYTAPPTSRDDACLIAFTSGTTGEPKAAMHFHRDVLAMCDTYAEHILPRFERAVFSGTPPIAFTFGLGALLAFPLHFGASIALPAKSTPAALAQAIARHRVTHVFTSPTGYRVMLEARRDLDLSSLRVCVSAGEHLPEATWQAWRRATGINLLDGIGATEMMHIFVSSREADLRPGSVGRPVPGFTATLLDEAYRPIEGVGQGRLAVRGPVGCRYLNDPRQVDYVRQGWNLTGDIFRRDQDGYFWYVGRADEMIISSGYNIAGPEVEAALLAHEDVEACAVVGAPDIRRGQIVKAFVVLRPGAAASPDEANALQDHVKRLLAPYKYPRAIEFLDALPRTATGKIARRLLREPSPSRPAGPQDPSADVGAHP
jgi:2-aminobenzoate-CoA ligase